MTRREFNQKRLPDGYWVQRWTTMSGTSWEVFDKITNCFLVRGQKTPKAAVDLALKLIQPKDFSNSSTQNE